MIQFIKRHRIKNLEHEIKNLRVLELKLLLGIQLVEIFTDAEDEEKIIQIGRDCCRTSF